MNEGFPLPKHESNEAQELRASVTESLGALAQKVVGVDVSALAPEQSSKLREQMDEIEALARTSGIIQ